MWEPMSVAARISLVLAQQLALRLGSSTIDPEHVFLGALECGHNGVTQALLSLGIAVQDARSAAEKTLARSEAPSQQMEFAPNTKRVIELAYDEAHRMGHNYVGIEHLMLAYADMDPPAQAFLRDLCIDPATFKAKLLELLPQWKGLGDEKTFEAIAKRIEENYGNGADNDDA